MYSYTGMLLLVRCVSCAPITKLDLEHKTFLYNTRAFDNSDLIFHISKSKKNSHYLRRTEKTAIFALLIYIHHYSHFFQMHSQYISADHLETYLLPQMKYKSLTMHLQFYMYHKNIL